MQQPQQSYHAEKSPPSYQQNIRPSHFGQHLQSIQQIPETNQVQPMQQNSPANELIKSPIDNFDYDSFFNEITADVSYKNTP